MAAFSASTLPPSLSPPAPRRRVFPIRGTLQRERPENAKGKTRHPVIRGFDLGKGVGLVPGEKLQIVFPSGLFMFGAAPPCGDRVL